MNSDLLRFKEGNGDVAVDMVVDLDPISTLSWKDKLLGKGAAGFGRCLLALTEEAMERLIFLKAMSQGLLSMES